MATSLLIDRKIARRWRLALAGNFVVVDLASGRDVTPRSRKACAIIAYLASHPGSHVPRERITELLWGDRGEAQARASLRQALVEIRHAVPSNPALVDADRGHLWISPESVDLSDAADAGDGDFLPFADLNHISREFDDWLAIERTRRARHASEKLRHEVERMLAAGKGASSFDLIEAMWRVDPFDEDALRLALQAEYQAGHPAGIEQRYKAMAQRLSDELGVEPSAETRALHDRLLDDLKSRKDFGNGAAIAGAAGTPKPMGGSWRLAFLVLATLFVVLALALGLPRGGLGAEPDRVAVLPFRALEGVEPVLAEGLAEEVLARLSRQRDIETIGRTSSWKFKDQGEDLRRVGKQLDVDYVVEGSVRAAGNGLRATVALIDARDASTLWSGSFVSPSANVQNIEDAASRALMMHLGIGPQPPGQHTDPIAYANYVQAKAMIRDRDWSQMRIARNLLRESVRIDPNFAAAWAQLGGAIYFAGSDENAGPDAETRSWREATAAAQRSITLQPNLAEGHAMLALIYGFDSEKGAAHLRHALQLDPNNPQTVYWSSIVAAYAGNFEENEKAIRRALKLDPLWRRPLEVAGHWAIWQGRPAEAYQLIERVRSADHSAAVELEMSFARKEGDLSRVIEIGRREPVVAGTTAAKMSLSWSLIELGYVREGLLLGDADRIDRLLVLGQLPNRQQIMKYLQPHVGRSNEFDMVKPVITELVRTERFGDVAALYDRPGSLLRQLGQIKSGNRDFRMQLAALVGMSLARVGREREATQLFRAAGEANRVIMRSRLLGPSDYMSSAINYAVMGQEEQALTRLEQAVARGWMSPEGISMQLGEMPWFENLRGEPRFERLRRTTKVRLDKERRETEALGVI